MKIQELKKHTRHEWEMLNGWKGVVLEQPGAYEKEIKRFGDRRRRDTWIAALAHLTAVGLYRGCLDAYELITIYFNFKPGDWDYDIREQIFDQFVSLPEGMELIKTGLEQLFEQGETEEYRSEISGIFELLGERKRRLGGSGGADEFAGFLRSAASAA